MKVILLKDVKNVGKKDEVKEVSDGYGRNYLIKNQMAVAFTKDNANRWQKRKDEEALQDHLAKKEAEQLKEDLKNVVLEFQLSSSKDGKTFGKISSKQIAAALAEKGINIDKRKIKMETPVDSLGTTIVKADLYKNQVHGDIKVHVSAKEK